LTTPLARYNTTRPTPDSAYTAPTLMPTTIKGSRVSMFSSFRVD
jgi:hypothetical protein